MCLASIIPEIKINSENTHFYVLPKLRDDGARQLSGRRGPSTFQRRAWTSSHFSIRSLLGRHSEGVSKKWEKKPELDGKCPGDVAQPWRRKVDRFRVYFDIPESGEGGKGAREKAPRGTTRGWGAWCSFIFENIGETGTYVVSIVRILNPEKDLSSPSPVPLGMPQIIRHSLFNIILEQRFARINTI